MQSLALSWRHLSEGGEKVRNQVSTRHWGGGWGRTESTEDTMLHSHAEGQLSAVEVNGTGALSPEAQADSCVSISFPQTAGLPSVLPLSAFIP